MKQICFSMQIYEDNRVLMTPFVGQSDFKESRIFVGLEEVTEFLAQFIQPTKEEL